MRKRMLALLLCVSMLLPLFARSAPAANAEGTTLDYSADVGKYAQLNSYYADGVVVVHDGSGGFAITEALLFDYAEFEEGLIFCITDWYCDEVNMALWYQVEAYQGSLPADMPAGYWIFQNYISDGYEEDTLTFVTVEEPTEPEETEPEETEPEETEPEETEPEETEPEETEPEETEPEETEPEETEPEETEPEETEPEETEPEETEPEETEPEETEPEETEPEETEPEETEPEETEPEETEPEETEPEETEPQETLPDEILLELLESVSKESYERMLAEYAELLAQYTITEEQQAILDAHYAAVPYVADIVYTPWSGRVGPMMPPVTVPLPTARMAFSLRTASADSFTAVDNAALKTSKVVTYNEETGAYTITIEAYAEGTVTVTTKKTACDVILVLDMSSSMTNSFSSSLTREEAVEDAVQAFAAAIIQDGAKNTTDHRVAVITYNTTATVKCGLKNVLTNSSTVTSAVSDTSLATSQGTRSDLGIDAAIDVFNNDTSTYTFTNDDYTTTSRQRVVIFFTDGYPSTSGSTNFNGTYAQDAINNANTLKNSYGAAVYSVAVLDDASPTGDLLWTGTTGNNPEIGLVNGYLHAISSNYPDATASYTASSSSGGNGGRAPGDNSGSGTLTISNTGTGSNQDYYLTASDPDDLNEIFDTVSSTVISGSTSVELGTETTVTDIVTPQFLIPENATVDVSIWDCTGTATDGSYGWTESSITLDEDDVTVDGNTLDVSGFDFTANYVASVGRYENSTSTNANFYGRKMVITFNVEVDPDFLGGSGVVTNEDESGIYKPSDTDDSETLYENLVTDSEFDVPLKEIETVVQDRHIYLGNSVNLTDILALYVVVSDDGDTLQVTADGVNNAYVNLKYEVTLSDQTIVTYTVPAGAKWEEGTWTDATGGTVDMSALLLTEDTQYSVVCTMSDPNGVMESQTADGTATIYVYYPVLKFRDAEKVTGETVDYLEENFVRATSWARADGTLSTDVTMEGTAPNPKTVYGFTFSGDVDDKETVADEDDFYVNVEVSLNGTSITDKVKFDHSDCSGTGECEFNPYEGEFMIHILGSLTITKRLENNSSNALTDQSFTFTVTGPENFADYKDRLKVSDGFTLSASENDAKAFTVTVPIASVNAGGTATNSVTITGLPSGTYTVTEAAVAGFASTVTPGSVEIAYSTTREVTCVNKFPVYVGDLTVEKVVEKEFENDTLPEQTFSFTLELTPDAQALANWTESSTYAYQKYNRADGSEVENGSGSGSLDFQNGAATITFDLTGGQYIVFYDLPVGAYSVTEAAIEKFETTYENASGTIVGDDRKDNDQSPLAKVINTYEKQAADLTITRTDAQADQVFVYEVREVLPEGSTETPLVITVTVTGNGSTTIHDLPTGEYTVTQLNGWSWRYSDTSTTVAHGSNGTTVTFDDGITKNQWLNGNSELVENVYGGGSR